MLQIIVAYWQNIWGINTKSLPLIKRQAKLLPKGSQENKKRNRAVKPPRFYRHGMITTTIDSRDTAIVHKLLMNATFSLNRVTISYNTTL